eukprot:TRINITY_DN4604_c0_g1_i1.p1 TRINITY_DN4604_c0_g1~~TRINITY_DN4604_c0_g1_i1.p1  ORF type:complete len:418 (-),score=102.22 TRINITY_DN4604_c0_g1_i1:161-1414(-)
MDSPSFQRPPPSPVRSPGMNHREALTRGLEDFQRMLSEVRQSNGVLTDQLKQFEGSLEDVRATNDHLGRQLTDFGDRLQGAKKEEDEIAAELKRFSERLAIAKANLEGDLFRSAPQGAASASYAPPALGNGASRSTGLGLTSSALGGSPARPAVVSQAFDTSDQGARALLDQHHDTIKWLHSHYSVVGEISVDQAFSVTKLQFWRLACDCGLLPKTAPRGEIDAVFSRAVQDLGEGSDPTMAYPAFQEGIMQLAAMKYRHGSAQEKLNSFLTQDLLPIADQATDQFRSLLGRPGPQNVFGKYRAQLLAIFRHYARLDTTSNDAAARQSTINLREFISMLRECDAIDRNLSMQAIMEIFVQSNVDVDSQENLDTEFIYAEFIEALARCADAKIAGRTALAEKLEQFLTQVIFPSAQSS